MVDESEEVPPSEDKPSLPHTFNCEDSPKKTGSEGEHPATPIQQKKSLYLKAQDIKGRIMCDMDFYFKHQIYAKVRHDFHNAYSVIPEDHPDRLRYRDIFTSMLQDNKYDPASLGLTLTESRGVAAVLGMAVADALGASTEFEKFRK